MIQKESGNKEVKTLSIISLKYSPGLLKEMIALKKAAKNHGFEVNLVLNSKYDWLIEEDNSVKDEYIRLNNLYEIIKTFIKLSKDRSRNYIFYNFHPLNILLSLFKGHKNINVYIHEPWMDNKIQYGLKRMIMVTVLEKIQKIYAIYGSSQIVVPSEHARNKAKNFKLEHKNSDIKVCPLMLKIDKKNIQHKDYFLFLGRLHGAKAFDEVLKPLKLCKEYKLKVLTTSKIPENIFLEYKDEISSRRLDIVSKDNLSENEIQDSIISSIAVLKLDKLMTQSGVVALSFALGTPVIARNILGFSQDVNHKINGYLINENESNSLINALNWVSKNSKFLSENSRIAYETKFSECAWRDGWGKILNTIKRD